MEYIIMSEIGSIDSIEDEDEPAAGAQQTGSDFEFWISFMNKLNDECRRNDENKKIEMQKKKEIWRKHLYDHYDELNITFHDCKHNYKCDPSWEDILFINIANLVKIEHTINKTWLIDFINIIAHLKDHEPIKITTPSRKLAKTVMLTRKFIDNHCDEDDKDHMMFLMGCFTSKRWITYLKTVSFQ